jgi:hypothetical protein
VLYVDKRLKIDKHLNPIYMSHKPRPIKVVETAPSVATKADEIAKETAETGKVTAVVAVMSKEKDANCGALVSEMRGLLAKRRKEPIFCRKIPADCETLLKNQEKVGYQ